MTREQQLRRALLLCSAILQTVAQEQRMERRKAIIRDPMDQNARPWEGTIGDALDLADAALEPNGSRVAS